MKPLKKKEKKICLRYDEWYPNHYWGSWYKPFCVKGSVYAQFKQCLGCGIAEKKVFILKATKLK